MFSKSCEYAIRACVVIYQKSEEDKLVNIKELSVLTDTPAQYLAKTMQILTNGGLVKSQKGPSGGFYFEKDTNLRLIQIVHAIDGDDVFTKCGLGLKQCSEKNPCCLHHQFKLIRNDIKEMLVNNSIAMLAQNLTDGNCAARTVVDQMLGE